MSKELIDKIITCNYNEFGNEFGDCIVDMKQEIENLKNIVSSVKEDFLNANSETIELKSRIDKAIEYIYENTRFDSDGDEYNGGSWADIINVTTMEFIETILKMLNGSDKE